MPIRCGDEAVRVTRRGGRLMLEPIITRLANGALLNVYDSPHRPAVGYVADGPVAVLVTPAEVAQLRAMGGLRSRPGSGPWSRYVWRGGTSLFPTSNEGTKSNVGRG